MQDRSTGHRVSYTHSVLEGTAYQVGQQQAEWLARYPQAVAQFLTPPLANGEPLTPQQADEATAFFDRYCPGLNQEIQGFADGLSLPPEQVLYYATAYAHPGRCSHMVVLPSVSKDGHLYVGRSYEWSHEDEDLNLSTTRVAGRAAHIGFSTNLFGRVDGLNQYGLCVTMSAGTIPNVPAVKALAEPGGCRFWAAIRAVLDRCRTVDEALEVVHELPLSSAVILILADRSGQAALVEVFDSHRAVKRVGPGASEGVLFATNHYTLPAMLPYDVTRMWQSVARYRAIESRLQAAAPRITPETIRGILTDPLPQGTYCRYYSDYLGTLWSQIFDLTAGTVEVCFGGPAHNRWHAFDLDSPVGLTHYSVELHDEAADPTIWRVLPPGTMLAEGL